MGNKAGIWLDFQNAYIIFDANLPDDQIVKQLVSEVEDFRPRGGSRGDNPYSSQEAVSEQKYLERRKHQLKRYFEKITASLKHVDTFFIFGPSSAKTEFEKMIKGNSALKTKYSGSETADIMTLNQMKERVRKYYK